MLTQLLDIVRLMEAAERQVTAIENRSGEAQ